MEIQKEKKIWRHWMMSYSLGDLVIMGGVAAIGRLLLLNYSKVAVLHNVAGLSWIVLLVAGIVEGLLIGYIEWKSLSSLALDLRLIPWVAATMLATIAGWIFIASPAIVYISLLSRFSELNRTYYALYSGIAGLSFGTLVGMSQYLILKRFYKNAPFWIFSNAAAWMLSFIIIYSALALFTNSPFTNIVLAGAACIGSGLVQGSITGLCLRLRMSLRSTLKPN